MTQTPGAGSRWPRRLMPVPVSRLQVDSSVAATSPKGYSDAELRQAMRDVPEIYAMLDRGVPPREILDLRGHSDPHLRSVGTTYGHLFGATPSSQVLAADVVNGQLEVTKGNHRIRAARQAGVEVLPVEVAAQTAEELDAVASEARGADPARYPRFEQAHARATSLGRDAGRDQASSERSVSRDERART
ncbi:MAG TPA: hypothetical protein VHB18_05235 [Mycobacteriales bacterium]|nr:hypothetical protein [Mycobacteriales bacterium]